MKNEFILEMENITKKYPGVTALSNVNFRLKKGEVHALIGENGAGKSTLMKILSGVVQPTSGSMKLRGKPFLPQSPRDSINKGIAIIHQERSLIDTLNTPQNIFLGREQYKGKMKLIDKNKMLADTKKILSKIAPELPLYKEVRYLSSAQQQLVEIAKAISLEAEIIIMDEPTASLTNNETQALFEIISNLKKENKTIVYISHRMEEIFKLADTATILRDGCFIKKVNIKETNENELINLMVGRDIKDFFVKETHTIKEKIMEVRNFTRKNKYHNISFSLMKGEVLGIFGLVGSGRTELVRGIFGADPKDSGEIYIEGKKVIIKETWDAIQAGIALVPEERKEQGVLLKMSIKENITLSILKKLSKIGMLNKKKQKDITNDYVKLLNIKISSINQQVLSLSGGNQQKVALSKWMATNSKILILDEPTRGIDVGAKSEIYKLIQELSKKGYGIIVISSEMPEIIGISDRILIMREHELVGEIDGKEATEELIMNYCVGRTKNE